MMALGTVNSQYLDGSYSMTCAQETYAAADRAVVQIIRKCHQEAKELLEANRDMLDAVAQYLLKKETITGQEMMAILEGRDPEKTDYFGINPGAAAKIDSGIEPPARSIHMTSQPVQSPAAAEESHGEAEAEKPQEEAGEEKPQTEGSGGEGSQTDGPAQGEAKEE